MVTAEYDHTRKTYFVMSRGQVISEHKKASAAKRAAKRYGKKHGEPASYKGPRMSSAKFIFSPSPENQFGD